MVMPDHPLGDPVESTDTLLCPKCLTANGEHQHFCRKCATPLSNLSVTDPIGAIYSEMDTYRKGMDKPNRFVLTGFWMLFLPGLVMIPVVANLMLSSNDRTFQTPLGIAILPLTAIIPLAILYRVTSNYKIARLRESLEPKPPANKVDDDLGPEFESIDWE